VLRGCCRRPVRRRERGRSWRRRRASKLRAERTLHLADGGISINTQLAQARELKAKLAEEYHKVWLLRATIAGVASVCGECVCELSNQARGRINYDFNVDDPNTPPHARQKLIAEATLL
jgi:hypothetical protein